MFLVVVVVENSLAEERLSTNIALVLADSLMKHYHVPIPLGRALKFLETNFAGIFLDSIMEAFKMLPEITGQRVCS